LLLLLLSGLLSVLKLRRDLLQRLRLRLDGGRGRGCAVFSGRVM
jgi:hypothetical protein